MSTGAMRTYEYEYDKVQDNIDGAATYEEAINIEAVTLNVVFKTVPGVVNRMTLYVSLCYSRQSRRWSQLTIETLQRDLLRSSRPSIQRQPRRPAV